MKIKTIYILGVILVVTLLAGLTFVSANVDCIDHSLTIGRAVMRQGIIEEKVISKWVCFSY